MKPRTTLATTALPDGSELELQEHDGRHALMIRGQQLAGPATRAAEQELARLACAPFRPVKQPTFLLCGLGLGAVLETALNSLQQKRAIYLVAEPVAALVRWHREILPEAPWITDPRVKFATDFGPAALQQHLGTLHGVLIHLETAPLGPDLKPWTEQARWIGAVYESLVQGGMLAIAASKPNPRLRRRLQHAGFAVADHFVPSSPNARKPRMLPIYLARKGKFDS